MDIFPHPSVLPTRFDRIRASRWTRAFLGVIALIGAALFVLVACLAFGIIEFEMYA